MPSNNNFVVGTQIVLFKTLNGRAAAFGRIYVVHGLRRVENINVYIGTRMYNNNTRLRY